MSTTGRSAIPRWRALGLALVLLLLSTQHLFAADQDAERAQLAAAIRQLDMLDSLAEHGATLPPPPGARYHFDYARLRADIARIRKGLRDYLAPQRAQPRDPVPLTGVYRRESEADETP